MTQKEFMNRIANDQSDVLQLFLDLLHENEIDYCIIGDLAVNAYVEPVVSLDLGIVVAAEAIDRLIAAAKEYFAIKKFEHSLNLKSSQSELRIQIQTDSRYQPFLGKASGKKIMGYQMKVAALGDVLQGKIWAYSDEQRRGSKRQKDLADIFRLIEAYPHLRDLLPESIRTLGI